MFNLSKQHKSILKLLLIILGLYILWHFVYIFWLIPGGKFDFWLTQKVTENSISILNLFNNQYSIFVNPYGKCSILYQNLKVISVNHACNGQVLYPVFYAFIIATSGSWINKIIYISVGSVIIYICNLLRVVTLVLIRLNFPQYLNFNHKYTFTIVVYSVIFLMWYLWVNKFSKLVILKNEQSK
ncbi:MAG: archaeosortase/exosortase family protein [Cytophagales bacterium]